MSEAGREIPRATLWFVRIFLAVFFICAVFGVELWPFTGFRLFSHLRTQTQTVWQADTQGPGGPTPVDFNQLPRAYQGFQLIMPTFADLPPATKEATCQAWLRELRLSEPEPSTTALSLVKETWNALPRAGVRPASSQQDLVYECH